MEEKQLADLVSERETAYFVLMLVLSLLIYFLLFISIIGGIYVLFFAVLIFIMQGLAVGGMRQNAVKITPEQFGDIYGKIEEFSQKLNLKKVPDVYLMQSGGMLNAFATRFLFRDVVVIYSDVLELAYEQGENAVNFILAHELAHVKRKHLSKQKYIVCAEFIPFLGLAYSRACETTCDQIATALTDKLPLDGLLVLAAGKKLYKKVDAEKFVVNATNEKGFWGWFAEVCSTHPCIATRIKNISKLTNK